MCDVCVCVCVCVCVYASPFHSMCSLVPNSTVQIFNVSRTQDNTTIVAFWQPLVTTPPTGQVVRYYVEYRDATKGTSNVVYVTSAYNYIVLQNLLDANNYEVMGVGQRGRGMQVF